MTDENQPVNRSGLNPLLALILSALVLPGLGQLLTGRLAKGAVMAGALALWLPIAIIKAGRDIAVITPELLAKAESGSQVTFVDLQEAMAPMAGDLAWLFTPPIIIWLWSLIDSIKYLFLHK